MPLTDCLGSEELQAYQQGRLSSADQDRVGRHLEVCETCEALADRVESAIDPVVAALRKYPPNRNTPWPGSPSAFQSMLANHETISPDGRNLPSPPDLSRRWIGDYQVIEELGRGGMGVVYKARQRGLNRIVALKMVLSGKYATPSERTRFLVEAEMVARLTHPSIVQIHEVGEHEGLPFLAFEFIEGGSLAEQLNGKPWEPRRAAALVEQLGRAVHHAHQRGVIHRDLKPANVLIDKETSIPKIVDFGLARGIEDTTGLTRSGILVGTPAYMAPEQASGAVGLVGPGSDIYALGVVLYELLTGLPPFRGDNPAEILRQVETQEATAPSRLRPGLPRDLSTICLHCLKKEPTRRYASAEALSEDLGRFLQGAVIKARPVGRPERTWKWARRRPAIALLLLAITIILPSGTGVSTFFAVKERARAHDLELSRAESLTARRNSDLNAAELTFRASLADADQGLVDRAMFRLLEALRLAPPEETAFRHVLLVNLAIFAERLPVLQQILPGRRHGWFVGPDGSTMLTASLDNVLEHWDTASGRKLDEVPSRGPWPEEPNWLSRDGRTLMTIDKVHNLVRLRETATKREIGAPKPYGVVELTADNRMLALSREIDWLDSQRHVTEFYLTKTGQAVGPTTKDDFRLVPTANNETVLMTFPGRSRLSADFTTPARFSILETNRQLDQLPAGSEARERNVVFDGNRLVTLDSADGTVRWWNPVTGSPVGSPKRPLRFRNTYLPFSALTADGRTVLGLTSDNRVRWVHPMTGQSYATSLAIDGEDIPHLIESSPEGNLILSVSSSIELRQWRVPMLAPLASSPAESTPDLAFRSIGFSADARHVFVGGNRSAHPLGFLMETITGLPVAPNAGEIGEFPAFSGDSKWLVTSAPPIPHSLARVIVREVATGKKIWNEAGNAYVRGLALDTHGRRLAIGRFGVTLLVDLDANKTVRLKQEAGVTQLLFSPDDHWLATGSQKGWGKHEPCFRVWNVKTGQAWGDAIETTDAARFCFTPDSGTLVALEPKDGRLHRWKIGAEPVPERAISLHLHKNATCAVFRSDARQVLIGFPSGSAQMYDTMTGEPVGAPLSGSSSVVAVAFSPDGALAAVAGDDGAVQFWDALAAKPLGAPLIHRFPILGIAFEEHGRSLFVTTVDGSTFSWSMPAPLPDDLEKLTIWLQAATGSQLENNVPGLLNYSDWTERRRRLREIWPEAAAALEEPASSGAWHQAAAREAEDQRDVRAAAWHVDRLLRNQSVGASNSDWTIRARQGHLRALAGLREEAAREYEGLEQTVPKEKLVNLYRFHGDKFQAAGQWDFALWYIDHAILLRPEEWQLYAQRADLHLRLGHAQQRLADLTRSVELGGTGEVLVALAGERVVDQRWNEARALLEKADAPWKLGLVLQQQSDQTAYQKLRKEQIQLAIATENQLEIDAANEIVRLCTLDRGSSNGKDLDFAIKLAKEIVAAVPKNTRDERRQVLTNLGGLQFRRGQSEQALATFREALEVTTDKGALRIQVLQALTQRKLGQAELPRDLLTRQQETKTSGVGDSVWESLEIQLLTRELERSRGPKEKGAEDENVWKLSCNSPYPVGVSSQSPGSR